MRIELVMTVLAGFSGGLVAAVWSGVVSSALLAGERRARSAHWHADSVRRLLALIGSGIPADFVYPLS